MKKFLTMVALVGLVASSVSAIELSLVPGQESEGDKVDVNLSATALVSIYMNIGSDDGNVSFFKAFLDAVPFGSEDAVGYDVMGNIFKMERNDGTGWFRNEGNSSDRNIEEYFVLGADDDKQNLGPGTDGRWEGIVDSIIIHGTELGDYELYFENPTTAEGATRIPELQDIDNNTHPYAFNIDAPGSIHFKNAWIEATPPFEFNVPFLVNVVPEPASLALLAIGGLALLRRRK